MPAGHRKLAGHERRARTVTVFDHFQQVMPFSLRQRFQPEVIKYQQLGFGKRDEPLAVGTVAARDPQVVHQTRHSFVADA